MEKTSFTNAEIRKILFMNERYKSIQTLYNAEERGDIPKAHRKQRGKVSARHWSLNQIPNIGLKYGFLPRPSRQKVLCKYVQKGGVAKTTTSYNEGKTLALNGNNVLLIGLDSECSLTDIVRPSGEVMRLEDNYETLGLYHLLAENAPLENVIQKTSISTLDIIPETHDLVLLDKWLNHQNRREYVFKDKLIPLLTKYDVIIFDNGPNWNYVIENSIVASDTILIPLGCNLLAYNAVNTNLDSLFEFQEAMGLSNQNLILFATLLESSSLSQQIYAKYLADYPDTLIPIPIRRATKWQESLLHKQSIIEYAPTSQAARDFYELLLEMWSRINTKES